MLAIRILIVARADELDGVPRPNPARRRSQRRQTRIVMG